MGFVSALLFSTAIFFGVMDKSNHVFERENLYRKELDKWKNYIPFKELKYQVQNHKDPAIVNQLKKYLVFRRLSRLFAIAAFLWILVEAKT